MNAEKVVPAPDVDPDRRDNGAPADREPVHTVHFAFDSAAVAAADVAMLAARLPALTGHHVTVVGHTDATGSRRYNDDLALRRAGVVGDSLVSLGLPSADILIEGKGRCCYRAPNDTKTGRALNRRAEIFTRTRPTRPPATTASSSPH